MSASYGRSGHGLSGCSTGHVGPMSTIPLMPEAPAVGVSLGTVVSVAGTVVELASGARVAVPALAAVAVEPVTRVVVPVSSLAEPPQADAPARITVITNRIAYFMLIPDGGRTRSVPPVAAASVSR